ncbi:hypothetical protein [Pseudomonas sp. IT-P294]|uniref:hypothetical protein n=1 Tax=Pseudomonas sp. IT-P294 TaxID=3026454 RepID=UPI0039E04038
MNALFLGGSFTAAGNLPNVFKKMYEIAHGDECIVSSHTFSQAKLCDHFISKESRELLTSRSWSVVILQEQSKLPIDNPIEALKAITCWKEIIPDNTFLILMMTWRRKEDFSDCDRWAKQVDFFKKAHSLGVYVSPVGIAWEIYRGAFPHQKLMETSSSHSTTRGAELSATCLMESLSRLAAIGDKWRSHILEMYISAVAAHQLFEEPGNVIT